MAVVMPIFPLFPHTISGVGGPSQVLSFEEIDFLYSVNATNMGIAQPFRSYAKKSLTMNSF